MSLVSQIRKARGKLAKRSRVVALCQHRIDKFRGKWVHADAQVHRFARHPRRERFWRARRARAKRKIRFWTRREADAIEAARSVKARLARLRRKKAALQPKGAEVARKALSYVGVHEGSNLQREWAHRLGYSAYLPWCSIFAANMLIEAGVFTIAQLKAKVPNPAYSGAWIGAPGMQRVNRSEIRPGDFLIFDWGDGGLTDHVAIYTGNGLKVGGNESDRVEHDSVPWANVVAIVRPV